MSNYSSSPNREDAKNNQGWPESTWTHKVPEFKLTPSLKFSHNNGDKENSSKLKTAPSS